MPITPDNALDALIDLADTFKPGDPSGRMDDDSWTRVQQVLDMMAQPDEGAELSLPRDEHGRFLPDPDKPMHRAGKPLPPDTPCHVASEWDTLRSCVVGCPHDHVTARHADALCTLLEKQGVEVYRSEPHWTARKDFLSLNDSWIAQTASEAIQGILCVPGACSGCDVLRLGEDGILVALTEATEGVAYRHLAERCPCAHVCFLAEWVESLCQVAAPVRPGLVVAYPGGFVDGLLPTPMLDWQCVEVTRQEAVEGMACSLLCLGEDRLVLPAGCARVAGRLRRKGFEVLEIDWQVGIGLKECVTEIIRE